MKLVWVISYSSLLAFCLFCAAGDGKLKVWCRIDAYVDHKWYGQFPKSLQIRCSIIWHLDINFNKVWYRIWKRTPGLDKINGTFCFVRRGECTHTHTEVLHWAHPPKYSTLVLSLQLSPSESARVIFLFIKKVWAVIRWSISDKIRDQPIYEKFFTPSEFFSIEWKINPRLTRISVDNKIIIWHMPTKA